MNYNALENIERYKKQLILLIIIIFSIIISISVIKILIDIEKGYTTYKEQEKIIINRSRTAAIIILATSFYFASDAYKEYKKNQDRVSLNFLIAILLVLLAATIRTISLFKSTSETSVDEDNEII